jgi:hypothetical protein
MTSRASVLIALAAAVVTIPSLTVQAAMPVAAPQAASSNELTPVQDQKTTRSKKSKRQQEIDKSVETGTVPKRYKSSVPKEYHHLIPFAK